MTTTTSRGRWPRLLFLGLIAAGVVLYQGGFGVFATERELTWRLPVRAALVRRLDLQVYARGELLFRQELKVNGLSREPVVTVALQAGPHEALGAVWLDGEPTPRVFRAPFDPRSSRAVVLTFESRGTSPAAR